MSKDIFISYSRRDQEFVTRLASDLDTQVASVWFDQSTIQLGQKWHDAIMEGIRIVLHKIPGWVFAWSLGRLGVWSDPDGSRYAILNWNSFQRIGTIGTPVELHLL